MDKPLLSIILPSLRPSQLAQCLASIERYTRDTDYEVVVVSPFDIDPHPNVVHVKEARREGVCQATTNGYERAKGEYIILIPDYSRVTPLWAANMIAFMRPHDNEIFQGGFQRFDATGELPELTIYGKLYAPFSCIRKDKVPCVGDLFDCYYKSFYADPDLSLRVWHNGGRVETCPNSWVYYTTHCEDDVHQSSYNSYFLRDQEAFFQRWYHIYTQPGESRTFSACQGTMRRALSPELPPEECVKLYISLHRQDWETVNDILSSSSKDACIFPESLPVLYNYAMKMLPMPRSRKTTLYTVIKWLRKKGYAPPPFNARLLKESLLTHEPGWQAPIYFALRVIRFVLMIIFYFAMRFLDRSQLQVNDDK